MGCSPWGHKESDATEASEHTHTHTHTQLTVRKLGGDLEGPKAAQHTSNSPISTFTPWSCLLGCMAHFSPEPFWGLLQAALPLDT